ncbi:2,2-dialkylglycine decarboxylase (pyruvate) [Solirubrobacter pauli]|uniref:2,2-dialkylglycine decarboxylase (Pyruvate) n=1 Tax=Solirubrobacter pauli TaxID=166793 RepID=A0A660KZK1_9ACTN|nr:aspartate aminotransferase family protein [Solirubrobacter pauli]RKQ87046.1 2,2-dialkylglycine decarboxylase (pyruvate) [Solirubrobacter pauli]
MSVLAETGLDPAFWSDVDRHVIRYNPTFVPAIVERAEGSLLYTSDGRELIDFTSGQMSSILGHSHPAITATIREAAGTLDHLFSGMLSRPVVELSRRLAESLPDPLNKAMLLTTGAEVNEAALRLAKLVTGKHEVVAFSRSWHGMTLGAANATYSAGRKGYGPAAPGNFALLTPDPYRPDLTDADGNLDWRRQLDVGFQLIDAQSTGALAACIVEPILSSAGIVVPPVGYFRALREHCDRRGMLLIFDEAQTALYRTGDRYGFERDGVVPDIITMSKTLGAGLPLAAVVTTDEIEAAAYERKFLFYTTHVSDPLVASVGNTVLDVLENDGVGAGVAAKGELLANGLRELQERHAVIGDVRGRGLMQGLEIVLDRDTKEASPALGTAVTDRCLELGLHMNIVNLPELSGTFRIAPALTTTDEQLTLGLEILDQALTDVAPRFV